MIKQVTINECTCENPKCGATWLSRSKDVPKVCPRCGNRKWNKSEVFSNKEFEKAVSYKEGLGGLVLGDKGGVND
jgi:predicted  nucleic acid-binding Zn-ribbon protein